MCADGGEDSNSKSRLFSGGGESAFFTEPEQASPVPDGTIPRTPCSKEAAEGFSDENKSLLDNSCSRRKTPPLDNDCETLSTVRSPACSSCPGGSLRSAVRMLDEPPPAAPLLPPPLVLDVLLQEDEESLDGRRPNQPANRAAFNNDLSPNIFTGRRDRGMRDGCADPNIAMSFVPENTSGKT